MDCEAFEATAVYAFSREAPTELLKEARAHLEFCPGCQQAWREIEEARAALREAAQLSAGPPPAVKEELMSRAAEILGARPARPARTRPRRARPHAPRWGRAFALSLAAAAAVLVVVALSVGGPSREGSAPEKLAVPLGQEAGEGSLPAREQVASAPESAASRVARALEEAEPPEAEDVIEPPEEPVEAEVVEKQSPADESRVSVAETARPVARVARITGSVYYKRAGGTRWFRAAEGVWVGRGDSLDTRMGRALVELESGCRVNCNRNTWATFEARRLNLHRGEVCCEFGPGAAGLAVATADGVVRHLGTRFSVKVTGAETTVTVVEGKVVVENEKGKVGVEGGFQVSVRKRRKPGRPRKVDAAKLLAWTRALLPPRKEKLVYGAAFDAGSTEGWVGTLVRGSAFDRPGGALCSRRPVGGGATAKVDLERPPAEGVLRWSQETRLRFHYRIREAGLLKVQMSPVEADARSSTIYVEISEATPGVWHAFDMPLSAFQRRLDAEVPDGTRIHSLYIISGFGGKDQEFLIDNVQFYEPIP